MTQETTTRSMSWAGPVAKISATVFLLLTLRPTLPLRLSDVTTRWECLQLVAAISALWLPGLGTLLLLPVLWAMPHYSAIGLGLMPMMVVAIMGTIRWRWRAVLSLAVIQLVALVYDFVVVGGVPRSLSAVAMLLGAFGVGAWLRLRLSRQALGERQIASSRLAVERAREQERGALATELADLLMQNLREVHRALKRADAEPDPVTARRILARIGPDGRAALARLRLLVATLRSPTEDTGSVDLATSIDSFEDELVSHGLDVEREGEPPPEAEVPALFSAFLQIASDRILHEAQAGGVCGIRLDTPGSGTSLTLSYPVDPGARPPVLSRVSDRAAELGGSLTVTRDGDLLHLTLDLPGRGHDDRSLSHRIQRLGLTQRVVAAVSFAGLLIATGVLAVGLVDGADRWQNDLQWVVLCAGLLAAVWRPRLGLALLAVTVGLSYLWPVGELWMVTQPAIALAALTALLTAAVPWLALVLVAAWAGFAVTTPWPTPMTVFDAALVGLLAATIGLAAHFFFRVRTRQREEVERLTAERIEQQMAERSHLASELHDIIAHQLSLITMYLTPESLAPDQLDETVALVTRYTDSALKDLHSLLETLRSTDPATTGWSVRKTAHGVARLLEEAGHRVTLTSTPDLDLLDATTQQSLVRVVREAATNALRYAAPESPVHIVIGVENGTATARVTSALAPVQRSNALATGRGLLGLRERVELTNGRFSAGAEGRHWIVRADLPAVGLSPSDRRPERVAPSGS